MNGLLEADGLGVHERRLRDVELGPLAASRASRALRCKRVELRALPRAHAHRVRRGRAGGRRARRMKPSTLRTTSSKPGMARSVLSAARSAGCSQARSDLDERWIVGMSDESIRSGAVPGMRHASREQCSPTRAGRVDPRTPARDPRAGPPTSSTPHDSRTSPSVMPSAARRSGGTEACVIDAGWLIRLSTPPSDSASEKTRTRSSTCRARSLRAQLDGDHAAEAGHLPLGELVLRVRGQARIDHALVADLARRATRRCARPFASCCAHAEVQRLGAAQREPGVERARHRAGGVLDELQPRRRGRRRSRSAMPPIMSLWPFRYLVVEWKTMSAPSSNGRWKIRRWRRCCRR